METQTVISNTKTTTFKKVNNVYYKTFNVGDLNRKELLQFILDAMNNEASRVLAMLTAKYPEAVEDFEIRKQGGTPDYLKLNNPIEDVREMITINIDKLWTTTIDESKLKDIVIDIIGATIVSVPVVEQITTQPTQQTASPEQSAEIKVLLDELRVMKAMFAQSQPTLERPKTDDMISPTSVDVVEPIIMDSTFAGPVVIEPIEPTESIELTEPTELTIEEMKAEMIEAAKEADNEINNEIE